MKPTIYKPTPLPLRREGVPVDFARCRAEVWGQRAMRPAQCTRKPDPTTQSWTDPDTGEVLLFCATHHPDAVARRQEQSRRQEVDRQAFERARRVREGLAEATDDELLAEVRRRGLGGAR